MNDTIEHSDAYVGGRGEYSTVKMDDAVVRWWSWQIVTLKTNHLPLHIAMTVRNRLYRMQTDAMISRRDNLYVPLVECLA